LVSENGEEFPVELSVSPIQDGDSILFVGYLRDIIDRNAQNFARIELAHVKQNDGDGRDGRLNRSRNPQSGHRVKSLRLHLNGSLTHWW
jgi:hypothetical protein